jgi:uncharacterized protein with NAD-binding domain and iron-sulfur cluster
MRTAHLFDRIVIVGGGIAGLATALHLAPLPVTLLVASPLVVWMRDLLGGSDDLEGGRQRV